MQPSHRQRRRTPRRRAGDLISREQPVDLLDPALGFCRCHIDSVGVRRRPTAGPAPSSLVRVLELAPVASGCRVLGELPWTSGGQGRPTGRRSGSLTAAWGSSGGADKACGGRQAAACLLAQVVTGGR